MWMAPCEVSRTTTGDWLLLMGNLHDEERLGPRRRTAPRGAIARGTYGSSRRIDLMTTSFSGTFCMNPALVFLLPVLTDLILSTTSMPSITLPKAQYLALSSAGLSTTLM